MDQLEDFSILRAVVVEILAVDPAAVSPETRFREDLSADSLDLIEMVLALEDRFGIKLSGEDLGSIQTIQQALDVVRAAKSGTQ